MIRDNFDFFQRFSFFSISKMTSNAANELDELLDSLNNRKEKDHSTPLQEKNNSDLDDLLAELESPVSN